jgi:transposase
MSGKIFLAPHHSTEELEHRYKAAADGVERSHVQIIWLLSQGHAAKFVAEVTGYSSVWISKILWRYNDHGLAGLGDGRQDNPGAAPLLNDAQLEELRAVVSDPPPDGGLWTGRKVAQWISGRIGRLVSPQRGVEYLRRLDLTRQVPRPCNPKQSLYEQARFKKNLQARVSELLGAETTGPIEVWAFDEHRLGLKPIRSGRRAAARPRSPPVPVALSLRLRPAGDRPARLVHRRRRQYRFVQCVPGIVRR